ncbi:MAG TPA: dihydrolipoamide acetyltransferase family protein [Solirubrobacterales bacterium]|jgi:pyruvate dehydrogenase E2 component (dihydrolipoamide acetyltransferase)|nr:dihydrolipoamide acetyltransferase family protein [Solirubrobacterales bacterium]
MDVVLPQMGLEVSEGTVTAVLVAVGDTVSAGDTVVEVETDKAIAEVAAPESGEISAVLVTVGETVSVGAPMVRIGAPSPSQASPGSVPSRPEQDGAATPAAAGESANGARRLRAAPIARRAAAKHGLALESIGGSGPAGRITLGDVERAARERAPADPAGRLESLSATRQSIARRLTESQLIPQYQLSRDIDASWLLAEKRRLTDAGPAKVGVVDLLLQGLAETLVRHPLLAASFIPAYGGAPPQLRRPESIDLGLAVATERGLLVPVLRAVEEMRLADLVLERARLVELARAGRLGAAEMGGSVATLSSLGSFGVDRFNAMLNPGESAILAVGRTVERAVPRERGIAVVPTLSLTFTFDHRVVDGATGAAALSELAGLLEGEMTWRV